MMGLLGTSIRSSSRLAAARGATASPLSRQVRCQTMTAQAEANAADIKTFQPTKEVANHMEAIIAGSKKEDPAPARVLLADESEDCINQQINVEYTNCYMYHAMASYFARDSVALHGFAAYFRHQSDDERGHAQMFMDFLSKRGGRVQLGALSAPPGDFSDNDQGDALNSMNIALALEKLNFEKITAMSEVADKHGDSQFADFLDEMLQEQAQEVKDCADMVSNLRRVGKGYPVFEYDKYLASKMEKMAAQGGH